MKVLFYCGIGDCDHSGTMVVTPIDWTSGVLQTICPACGQILRQSELHFEDLDIALQRERADICKRKGPLTRAERKRLRAIHEALGHHEAGEFTPEQESLVMKIASNVMQRIRNEEKN